MITLTNLEQTIAKLNRLPGQLEAHAVKAADPSWWSALLLEAARRHLLSVAGANRAAQVQAMLATFGVVPLPGGARYELGVGDPLAWNPVEQARQKVSQTERNPGHFGVEHWAREPMGLESGIGAQTMGVPGNLLARDLLDAELNEAGSLGGDAGKMQEIIDAVDRWVREEKRLKSERRVGKVRKDGSQWTLNDYRDINYFPPEGGGYNALTLRVLRLMGIIPGRGGQPGAYTEAMQDAGTKLARDIGEWMQANGDKEEVQTAAPAKVTVRRASDFADSHAYEVTYGDQAHRIYRDTEQFGYSVWYLDNDHVKGVRDKSLGFTKEEAVARLQELYPAGKGSVTGSEALRWLQEVLALWVRLRRQHLRPRIKNEIRFALRACGLRPGAMTTRPT